MTDLNELIPELRDWNNGAGIDIEGWIGCEGNFRLAIGYSTVFWPRFVEFEGYIFREGFSIETLRSFEKGGDRDGVEAVMNHLPIADIQHHFCEDKTRERIVYLGNVMREIHEAKLAWQFPKRRIKVHFDASHHDDLHAYELTFWQESESA